MASMYPWGTHPKPVLISAYGAISQAHTPGKVLSWTHRARTNGLATPV